MRRLLLVLGIVLMAAFAAPPAGAQQLISPKQLESIAKNLQHHTWYPPGYYEARLGAEAYVRQYPRSEEEMLFDVPGGAGLVYDITDAAIQGCVLEPEYAADVDAETQRWGPLAIEVARIGAEMERLGYPTAAYAPVLADYERAEIAILLEPPGDGAPADGPPADESLPLDIAPDALDEHGYIEWRLTRALNAARRQFAPKSPVIVAAMTVCADGRDEVRPLFRTSPAGGELWIISAFAFNVCLRKHPDPWDTVACRWREVETGRQVHFAGRFVYQVRWPDGTVRRGTREISDTIGVTDPVVTFRKRGS